MIRTLNAVKQELEVQLPESAERLTGSVKTFSLADRHAGSRAFPQRWL